MDVTIIVPTMNRPDLLARLINYYASLNFQGKILIGDSSETSIFQKAVCLLAAHKSRLCLEHYHLPGYSVGAVVRKMNNLLVTSYACLLPDDDFLVPEAIGECIKFLDQNNEFVAAHGVGVLVGSRTGDARLVDYATVYYQTISQEATASERLNKHFQRYSVSLFSIHRTAIWRKIFEPIPTPHETRNDYDKSFMDELLPCCLSVIFGKIGQVDMLYLVRQTHNKRYLLPSWFKWITGSQWQLTYNYFRDQLAEAIVEIDGIRKIEAINVVESSFSIYLEQIILKRETIVAKKYRDWFRKYKFLRQLIQAGREISAKIYGVKVISLKNLLSDSLPYRKYFLSVINAIKMFYSKPEVL